MTANTISCPHRSIPTTSFRSRKLLHISIITLLLGIQTFVLAWEGSFDGPTWDEVGHFAAGLEHWKHWQFELFSVNPPLIRLVATAPVVLTGYTPDPDLFPARRGPGHRPEFQLGSQVANTLCERYFSLLALARITTIIFSLVGGVICYKWAKELWGGRAGLLALTLWCFSPTVLAYGHLITPDLGSAAMGVTAAYYFRRWLADPTAKWALIAGLTLGLAELSKTTWIILIPLWPLLWILCRFLSPRETKVIWKPEIVQVLLILLMGWWILNLCYGFEGTFQRLGSFEFVCPSLGAKVDKLGFVSPGNRFTGTLLGNIPVPFPRDYIIGIDFMKMEFDLKEYSYLNGTWQLGGWWYYYIFAILYKETVGFLLLFALALCTSIVSSFRCRVSVGGILPLVVPGLTVFAFVSSQTGFSHHIRYILPAFPFAIIYTSRIGQYLSKKSIPACAFIGICMCWSVVSSLSIFPHHMSYFNELVGGPKRGYKFLDDSNLDWGQDLFYVKFWMNRHKTAVPLHLSYDVALIDPAWVGISYLPVPAGPSAMSKVSGDPVGPLPGWYCLSIKHIYLNQLHTYDYFRDLTPVDWVGYTMPVYHISVEEANLLRHRYGLLPVGASETR